MVLAGESVRDLSSHILAIVNRLAPLSIVVAVLTLLNTLRQGMAKRREERAQGLREILNRAGTKAYLLNWSLVGQMDVLAVLFQVRELIEARVGTQPSAEVLAKTFGDQLLIESLVEKAWLDSGVIAKFQQQALDFSQIQADIGDKIPLVRAALEAIHARLRMLFTQDSVFLMSIRSGEIYQNASEKGPEELSDPMSYIHRELLRSVQPSEGGPFIEACKLLEGFAGVTANAKDRDILKLTQSPSPILKMKEHLRTIKDDRRDRQFRQEAAQHLSKKFPDQSTLLCSAVDAVLRINKSRRTEGRQLRISSEHIARIFHGLVGSLVLQDASEAFLAKRLSEIASDEDFSLTWIRLKCLGVDDPEVDLFLGTVSGVLDLVRSALSRGANPNVRSGKVLARYKQLLAAADDQWFTHYNQEMTGLRASPSLSA